MFGRKSRHPGTPATATTDATNSKRPKVASTNAPPAAKGPSAESQAKGKLAYETRRAEKAGMGLDKWMAEKERRARTERDAASRIKRKSDVERKGQAAKPGLLRRLLDRAHRPL